MINSHDTAREALKYAVPGCTVVIEPLKPPRPNSRVYTLVLDSAPEHALSDGDVYALPCDAEALIRRAVQLCRAGEASIGRRPHRVR